MRDQKRPMSEGLADPLVERMFALDDILDLLLQFQLVFQTPADARVRQLVELLVCRLAHHAVVI